MKRGKLSLTARAVITVMVFMLMTNILLGTVLTIQTRKSTKTHINERMLDNVSAAAALLDGDYLINLSADDVGSFEYEEAYSTLSNFLGHTDLEYIYFLIVPEEKTFAFGIDPAPQHAREGQKSPCCGLFVHKTYNGPFSGILS